MITLLCNGSRGDVQPYVALALALQKAGKRVRIATGISFASYLKEYGIEHVPFTYDYRSDKVDPKLLEAARNSTNPLKMLLTFRKMKQYAPLMSEEMYNACVGSELLIYHPGCAIAYFAAKQLNIPAVLAAPFPMHKTKTVASLISYGKTKLPINASYTLLQSMLWMASKPGIELFWKQRFGRLPAHFGNPFERVDASHPSIISCSNAVFARPSDWSAHIHQYGYWVLEESYTPPSKLVDFLNAGDAPLYFGFGSVFDQKEQAFFVSTIKRALVATGKRAVLCGFGNVEPDERLFVLDQVSHQWLFPRCLAICHHGGAGTSAAVFAAGVPSFVVPFSNDQFAWAHRAHDLGVGAKPLYKKDFSVTRLVEAIEAIQASQMQSQAKILAQQLASEQGVQKCVALICSLLKDAEDQAQAL